jgi:NAD(P)-dependent dehydrogenase (short-subunit alcohol dehydrogenase family)
MQTLADELDTTTKIRVNSVNPGKVRTVMRAKAYPGEVADSVALPEVVLPTYLYLLGPASQGVTGQRFEAQSLVP